MSTVEPTPHDPPSGVVRVAIHGHFFEAEWINVFHLFVTPHVGFTLLDLTTLADMVLDRFGTNLVERTSEGNVSDFANGVAWDDDGPHDFESETTGDRGNETDPAIAAGTAALVNWRTDTHHRGGHPRTYIAGLTQPMLETTTLLTDSAVTGFTEGANGFLTEVNEISFSGVTTVRLGFVAFWRNHVALSPPLFFPYLSGRCRRELASQRRRQ